MQKHLETTSIALRTDPSALVQTFQQILSRPSYFHAPVTPGNWTVLLGPGSETIATQPAPVTTSTHIAPTTSRAFDFVAWQPSLSLRMVRRLQHAARSFYAWLMDPVIDTRTQQPPSEPAG